MLNSFIINNVLKLSSDNKFLTKYYSNQNKNIWISFSNTNTSIEYIIQDCIKYPNITNKIICIVLCRGFSDNIIQNIIEKEQLEAIPHFDLYQFLRRAIHHFNMYGTYISQMERFTVNSYADFKSIPTIKTPERIEELRIYKRNYYQKNKEKYRKYYREKYAKYKESMESKYIGKRENSGRKLRKKLWSKR